MSKLIFWPQARPERKRKHHFISLTVWTLLTPHNVFYLLNSNWRRIKNDNDERTQSTSTLRGSTSQNYTLFLLKLSPQSGWVEETIWHVKDVIHLLIGQCEASSSVVITTTTGLARLTGLTVLARRRSPPDWLERVVRRETSNLLHFSCIWELFIRPTLLSISTW